MASERQQSTPPVSVACNEEIAAIFDRTLPRVYGYLLLRVAGDRELAEDLTSETYLAFTSSWTERRESIPDPLAWLLGIARNKVIDSWRRQTAQLAIVSDLAIETDPVAEISIDLERIADRDELFHLLEPLSSDGRIVLLLRYLDGYSVREIAALLGKSEHAIESSLTRAKRAIRQSVDQNRENVR